jgi:hypothetical protein
MSVDLSRIAASALDSFLNGQRDQAPSEERHGENGNRNRARGGIGAVALGAGLALAARGAYRRARRLDLEDVGHAVKEKITG